ncbi:antitoxin YezG family protein [Pseudothauera rhizosphaerae]|uniref:DUF600 family protein n=1 Tax=Pseudothauera rhizosphaerae TaxID=2565932 RepID=A0A4S4AKB7_9RHOO|nr:hypothetical protein [Pseudothauera rhizosphaerae]THF59459.1 hypothetical protein E6O51_15835 [Pseudothauera rhizosphaerae]
MQFDNVEGAYNALAKYVLAFIGKRAWDSAGCNISMLAKMARGSQWLFFKGDIDEHGGFEEDQAALWEGLDAALFLRDTLLKTTGHRIWGLTFTLYPSGKFNIEYDYDKPEGYEETDELISGEEINRSLGQLGTSEEE